MMLRRVFVWHTIVIYLFLCCFCCCCCHGQTIGRLNPCKVQTDLIAENDAIQEALQAVPVQVELETQPVNPPTAQPEPTSIFTTLMDEESSSSGSGSSNTLDTILSVSLEYDFSATTNLALACRRNGFRFLELESVTINCTNTAGTTLVLLNIYNFPLCTGRDCNTSIEELDYHPIQTLALMKGGGWESDDFTCETPQNNVEEDPITLGNSIPVSVVAAAAAMFGIVCLLLRK